MAQHADSLDGGCRGGGVTLDGALQILASANRPLDKAYAKDIYGVSHDSFVFNSF